MQIGHLPKLDDMFDSKDWKASNYGDRVRWLIDMYRAKKRMLRKVGQQSNIGVTCTTPLKRTTHEPLP